MTLMLHLIDVFYFYNKPAFLSIEGSGGFINLIAHLDPKINHYFLIDN